MANHADHEDEKSGLDLEWENRVLCRDGNCIGVIGKDGRCKECGLVYDPDAPQDPAPESGPEPDSVDDDPVSSAQDSSDTDREEENSDSAPGPDSDPDDHWKTRTLCVDGNCIGVIGKDGRCKECGKPHPDFAAKS